MRSVFGFLTPLLFLSITVAPQDPTKTAPDSYRLQFDNEFVKVLRVTYPPHSKVPVHDHSRFPAAYVYLSDSGPIRFVHSGWEHPVLIRPATRAGSFRLSPTRFENETHAVENTGDLTSEFLRIEIKTEAPDRRSLSGRFAPFAGDRKSGVSKVEFENSQLRVTRIIARPGAVLDISASPEPSLIVVVAGAGHSSKGETFWLPPDQSKQFASDKNGGQQTELLRLAFKTQPKKR
ncbi:MAG TPA: cupin domain-containing protein [Pyrinomonadaceae bacterium]